MVVHLHGTVNSQPSFFVNSATTYSNIYFGSSLNIYKSKLNSIFNKNDTTIVFLGCSMEEDEVLSLFDLNNNQFKFYSIMKYDDNNSELSDFTSKYYRDVKNINYIWYGKQYSDLPNFLMNLNTDISNYESGGESTPTDIEKNMLG